MKNSIFLIAGLSAIMLAPASARVGGPFDSGTFNILMESSGTYQAALSFKNGSGFAYFAPNNTLQPQVNTTSVPGGGGGGGGGGAGGGGGGASANTTVQSSTLGVENRSIIYYQGFTFVGLATGVVNTEAGLVSGNTNGSSEFGSFLANSNVGGGGGGGAPGGGGGGGAAQNIPIVQNSGTTYVASSSFDAKITTQIPSITFKGRGQISFVSPDGFAASSALVSALVNTQYTALAAAAIAAGTTATTNYATAATPALNTTSVISQAIPNTANVSALISAVNQVNTSLPPQTNTVVNAGPPVTTTTTTVPDPTAVAINAALLTGATQGLVTPSTPIVNNTALNALVAGTNTITDNTLAQTQKILDQGVQAIKDAFVAPTLSEAAKNTDTLRMRVTGNLRYF